MRPGYAVIHKDTIYTRFQFTGFLFALLDLTIQRQLLIRLAGRRRSPLWRGVC
jgi:hypothetical protein